MFKQSDMFELLIPYWFQHQSYNIKTMIINYYWIVVLNLNIQVEIF